MSTVRDPNDHFWSGNHVFAGGMSLPEQSVGDGEVKSGANLSDSKLMHRVFPQCRQKTGTDVVSQTEYVHCAHAGESVLEVKAAVDVAPATGDKTVTIDVKKSHAGGAFSTLLATPLVINASSAATTALNATLAATPTLAEDDVLEITVTAAGSTGTQAQGLLVIATIAENGS